MNDGFTFDYESLSGSEILPHLEALAKLRIAVFREYPYLYDGSFDYELPYLKRYAASTKSLIVLMKHQGEIVGATSGLPLEDEMAEFRLPFEDSGHDLTDYFYFGESIILPKFRGRGAGGAFFQLREDHAASFETFRFTTFCAVERPHDHPAKPADYRPLHEFWKRQGYRKEDDLQCQLSWKEHGETGEVPHRLTFWTKPISNQSSGEVAS